MALTVEVSAAAGSESLSFALQTLDLSLGGAYLCSDLFFEVGETLRLQLGLPSGAALPVTGKVAWIKKDRDHDVNLPGMGVEFVALTDLERQALQELTQN